MIGAWIGEFQSTLPIRGATGPTTDSSLSLPNFNPRSPYGERPGRSRGTLVGRNFNPRSPYGERHAVDVDGSSATTFQSTLPIRGATIDALRMGHGKAISIHAPHTGSDKPLANPATKPINFNPRSPYGERPDSLEPSICLPYISIHAPHTGSDSEESTSPPWGTVFQSTLPIRGATANLARLAEEVIISIHAPHTGSDRLP